MTLEQLKKAAIPELGKLLATELRELGMSAGNLELIPVAEQVVEQLASKFYLAGVQDATKVFSRCAERFEEDVYILEQDAKQGT